MEISKTRCIDMKDYSENKVSNLALGKPNIATRRNKDVSNIDHHKVTSDQSKTGGSSNAATNKPGYCKSLSPGKTTATVVAPASHKPIDDMNRS